MKWLFISVAFILVFVYKGHAVPNNETTPGNCIVIDKLVTASYFNNADVWNVLNEATNHQNHQLTFQNLFPTYPKFLSGGILKNRNAELKRTNGIRVYILYAECHILRLEGVDIIYPYNTFL
jgi:hypothetical protein